MKKAKLLLAVLLVFVMVFSMAACGGNGGNEGGGSEGGETTEETPMVVGYSHFSSKFSPFFAETAYDQDVASMTQISLITTDRLGNVIMKGIEGEKAEYNGTEYTYYGPADLEMTENPDGTVFYDFTLRDDLTFSDGEPVTIDDVIFTMYVLCDPTYDGSSTLFAVPIEGMDAYRSGMDTLGNLIVAAGPDNTDFTFWTEEQQTTFWENAKAASEAIAQEIVDYCKGAGYNAEDDPIEACAANWGFELPAGATIEDFGATMMEAYGNNIAELVSVENAGSSIGDVFPDWDQYTVGIQTGNSAANIAGIQKTGDYSLQVKLSKVDATAIYQLGVTIAPLSYYGDPDKYDYDNNMFGFEKGDLSTVKAKTTEPMGAGPYKFQKFENGVVSFEANESYYLGAPHTKYINFLESQ
nr:ABC transporter substrate-binding protein [Clostridia bacterium]